MARILVQATLPHSRPNTYEFEPVNGRFTLYMSAPPSVGLPYGSYPRLALAWLSTEAVRTRSREIELGPTFSTFMYKLGLTPITGKRGTTSRLRGQLHRLFSTTIRCSYQESGDWHGREAGRDCLSPVSCTGAGYTIAHKHQLWWSPRDPQQEFGDWLGNGRGRTCLYPNSCSQGLAASPRHLLLAHLPDELPAEALPHPLGGTPDSVWRRLRTTTGLQEEVPRPPRGRGAGLPRSAPLRAAAGSLAPCVADSSSSGQSQSELEARGHDSNRSRVFSVSAAPRRTQS